MGAFQEIQDVPEKFLKYKEQLVLILRQYNIGSVPSLIKTFKNNSEFKEAWNSVWKEIAKSEGGKVSLTSIGLILGSSLGSVGIAAMGSAVGVPLVIVLGLGGLLSGLEFDSMSVFGEKKRLSIKLSKELIKKLELDSKISGNSIDELVEFLVYQAYKRI